MKIIEETNEQILDLQTVTDRDEKHNALYRKEQVFEAMNDWAIQHCQLFLMWIDRQSLCPASGSQNGNWFYPDGKFAGDVNMIVNLYLLSKKNK